MSRYIEMCKECMHYQMCGSISIDAPCAAYKNKTDMVKVVRCKDCKHLEVINSRDIYARCRMTDLEFKPFDIDTRKHYCSYGERREEND